MRKKVKLIILCIQKQKVDTNKKVITLKTLPNEDNYSVELFVGKKTLVDTCNNFFLAGTFEEKTVDGWGYNFYQFESNGNVAGSLMGCMNNKSIEKVVHAKKFTNTL